VQHTVRAADVEDHGGRDAEESGGVMGGRPRVPAADRAIVGGRDKSRAAEAERAAAAAVTATGGGLEGDTAAPALRPGEPDPPADLTEAERAAWGELVAQCREHGALLTRADRSVLEVAARSTVLWREAIARLSKSGGTVVVRNQDGSVRGVSQHPAVAQAAKFAGTLTRALETLGLTPAARVRLGIRTAAAAAPDPELEALRAVMAAAASREVN
jgi:P27 family predicted phage terminase small subunit